ncbi:hypothetical protein [Bacteroides eggerthii]|uniref:Uncharacterized protein n=1 Tax=Bacteroides eggerthii TaxID=28111 RepID=A0A380YTT2_9BACE|nr:hypothetical protein [Bacteroides eggerthii]EEC53797.1 hypothetical protein BACEGG_01942 [Bacteroides eggerthii DSM 20697]QRQ50203.1 hypothetical protein I6J51_07925 [Bacteroides eggerthii]UWN87436.1 hypothetical protein NQ546_14870 [Bacteroides eggerthii]SUV29872.1 Uncharacterised protein [Bacteroides eggerthii]
MFKEFINQLLGLEREPMPNRQETVTAPDVIEKAISSEPIPEKYQRDIEALRQKYGDAFKTGLCINLTLQEALSIIHRERKRIDAYSGLVSYLKRELGITLTITSQKTKPKSL